MIQSVKKLLKGIKKGNKELHCLLSLAFHCGMGKHEMCFAKIGDVTKKKGVFSIKTNAVRKEPVVEIIGDAFDILEKYLSNIQISSSDPNDLPLFPRYHGESAKRKISRDLDEIPLLINPNRLDIHMIKAAGIKMYYEKLESISNSDEALQSVGNRFRISTNEVNDQLRGKVKPAGKKKKIVYTNKETVWDIIINYNQIKAHAKPEEIAKLTEKFHAQINKNNYSDDKKNQLLKTWEEIKNH